MTTDPPLVPPQDDPDPPPASTAASPFAPTQHVGTGQPVSDVRFSGWFWLTLAGLIVGSLAVCLLVPALGIPALMAVVAASIRVPLLRKRLLVHATPQQVPGPLPLLLTSSALMLIAVYVSAIAFGVVCIPAGAAIYSLNNSESLYFPLVLVLSGLVGLLAFIGLFVVSLKLPA